MQNPISDVRRTFFFFFFTRPIDQYISNTSLSSHANDCKQYTWIFSNTCSIVKYSIIQAMFVHVFFYGLLKVINFSKVSEKLFRSEIEQGRLNWNLGTLICNPLSSKWFPETEQSESGIWIDQPMIRFFLGNSEIR